MNPIFWQKSVSTSRSSMQALDGECRTLLEARQTDQEYLKTEFQDLNRLHIQQSAKIPTMVTKLNFSKSFINSE